MGDKLNHRNCIYYIVNIINGKGYIGQTVYLRKRINEHKRNAKIGKQNPLYNAINKYGWENFEVIVLEENLSKAEIDEKEKYWIEEKQTLTTQKGYNIQKGGKKCCGGNNAFTVGKTDEELQEIKSRMREKAGHWQGKKHTDETKQKMSDNNYQHKNMVNKIINGDKTVTTKKKRGNPKPVVGVHLETFEIITYASKADVKKDGFSSDCVGNCITGKQQQHKGYKWYYLNEKGCNR